MIPPAWSDRVSRLEWPIVVLLLAAHAALAWTLRVPGITTGNDDALYLMLADQLAQGRYHDWFVPGAPPHGRYPPGFPAFLAVAKVITGGGFDALLACNIACSAMALALLHRLVRRKLSPAIALATLVASALSPDLIGQAGAIASEPLFMLVIAASLALLDRPTAGISGSIWAGLAAGGSALVRSAGVPLFAAQAAYWVAKRDAKRALAASLAGGLPVVAWLAWSHYAGRHSLSLTYWTGENDVGPSPVSRGIFAVIERIGDNALEYLTHSLPWALNLPTVAGTALDNVAWLIVTVTCLVIGGTTFARRWPAALWYLLAYGTLLVLWSWPLSRFLLPVLPLIVAVYMTAILGPGPTRPIRQLAATIFLLMIVAGSAIAIAGRAKTIASCERQPFPLVSTCYLDRQQGYFSALADVAASANSTDVLVTGKNVTAAYVTKLTSLPADHFTPLQGDALLNELRGLRVRYIVSAHLLPFDTKLAARLLEVCDRLTLRGRYAGDTLLFEVLPDPSADACEALAQRQPESVAMREPVLW